jgi:hypothetical protein
MANVVTQTRCFERASGDKMPTVLRWGPYRAFFYSNERDEPAHVHVRAGGREAKFWLS